MKSNILYDAKYDFNDSRYISVTVCSELQFLIDIIKQDNNNNNNNNKSNDNKTK